MAVKAGIDVDRYGFFKLVLSAATRQAYGWFVGVGLRLNLLTWPECHDFAHDWDLSCLFVGMNYNYVGSLFTSFA